MNNTDSKLHLSALENTSSDVLEYFYKVQQNINFPAVYFKTDERFLEVDAESVKAGRIPTAEAAKFLRVRKA